MFSIAKLFKKSYTYVGIDIGSTGIKLIELDCVETGNPRLKNLSYLPVTGTIFNNNVISSTDKVSEAITDMFQGTTVEGKKIIASIPGTGIFSKKIKTPDLDGEELFSHVQLEAGNFIPQGTRNVALDYHILGRSGKNQLEVQVIAAKNDVVDSYLDTFLKTSFELSILDIDPCAIQNMFEINYPELVGNVNAILHIGARNTNIIVCKDGIPLLYADHSTCGKILTESIQEIKGVSFEEAEKLKRQANLSKESNDDNVKEILTQGVEVMGTDLSRQLTFLWNSAGNGEGIDNIFIAGGASLLTGLADDIAQRTGIKTEVLNPFKNITYDDTFQKEYIEEMAPFFGVAVGLGTRYFRDRVSADMV